ncbi:MAG TPA: urate oxidase [Jiangellaceae bacterium]|jgi:urate oxidase|nr:urate oxidase [Jiangellaceae bacterium]
MAVTLGPNQYGKAEIRVVRVYRDSDPHSIADYNVSCALSGDFRDAHVEGDNSKVLSTDAMKNTVHAFALEHREAARQPESFGLALARHFVDDTDQVAQATVKLDMYPWIRLAHPHAFVRHGGHVRTAAVTYDGERSWVTSGVGELILLKTTDSEFRDFFRDRFTTLEPTDDRILATEASVTWWHTETDLDWAKSHEAVLSAMTGAFASHHSLALQQTAYAMGEAVLNAEPEIAEIRFQLANKHHFVIDLSPFGLDNPNEVFHADDRPYGLIEATVRRDGVPDPGPAFGPGIG